VKKVDVFQVIVTLLVNCTVPKIKLKEWEQVIEVLRESDLLACCYFRLKDNNQLAQLPDFALKHVTSAMVYSERQAKQVLFEAQQIQDTLSGIGVKPYFLKGASYTLQNSNNSRGRVYSDIDVLVSKGDILKSEKALSDNGWQSCNVSDYDDKYYREWSHEIPPMSHATRGTTLDLHHNIVLPISGRAVPIKDFVKNGVIVENGCSVLSLPATVMHSCVHLVINEECHHAFRDLLDISALIKDSDSAQFWTDIIELANKLNFVKELYIALSVANIFGMLEIPEELSARFSLFKDDKLLQYRIQSVYALSFQPHSKHIQTFRHALAVFISYIFGHLNKMPLKVLLPHLTTKLFFSIRDQIFGKHHFEP